MAALEATLSLSSLCLPFPYKFLSSSNQPSRSVKPYSFSSPLLFSHNLSHSPLSSSSHSKNRGICFELCSTAQEVPVEAKPEETQEANQRRKLFVLNLPWSFTVADIKELFGQCGTVSDVEIIKQKNGRSRGFAFLTMASGEEAQAAVDKLDSHEVSGRIIRVEFAKRFKRPSPPSPVDTPTIETRYKLYVSNLSWKVRSSHLREFFSTNFKPVSSRVIFDSSTRRSGGYGFVSFATKEEADAAISALDGKELMGRPIRLKFSETKTDDVGSKNEEENSENQPDE